MSEADRVRERYERRREMNRSYDDLEPEHHLASQAKDRALAHWMRTCGIAPQRERRLLDIGCGSAGDLLGLIRLGFEPSNLVGCELLEERVAAARHRLPGAARIESGDALELEEQEESFDVVYQSLVFTSLLDDDYQRRLAERMWSLVRPGGGILWFDFVYDNPRNPDVRGVPVRRVRELFPSGELQSWRVELAPPAGAPGRPRASKALHGPQRRAAAAHARPLLDPQVVRFPSARTTPGGGFRRPVVASEDLRRRHLGSVKHQRDGLMV